VQSWLNTVKAGDSRRSPKSRAPPPPPSSFMPPGSGRKRVTFGDSSSSADEASSLDDGDATPKRTTPGKGGEKRQTRLGLGDHGFGSSPRSTVVVVVDDDEDSSDVLPVATPARRTLGSRGKRKAVADESDEDSDDAPIATPEASRRGAKRPAAADESDEDEDLPAISSMASKRRIKRERSEDGDDDDQPVIHSTKRRRLIRKSSPVVASSPIKRKSNPRREKDKRRELLRRRRAGENITMDDLETSEEEETHALYDTDSDHVALEEFDDDEEGVPEPEPPAKTKSRKGKKNKQPKVEEGLDLVDYEEGEEEMNDFIEEDDEGTLGVPGELVEIPLEFTRHSRKPLKEHFRDVVEWLVRFKFEPNFDEKHNELYMLGWKKLDDEVAGLASSKFASSAWKPEFRRALNARPKFVSVELPRGDLDRLFGTCEACGRSGHPATWTVSFEGAAYYGSKKTDPHFLEDVESEEDEDESPSQPSSGSSSPEARRPKIDRDEDKNELPPETRQWSVGSVCKSNAETAHTLIHWKHNLLQWVGDTLENDGHMTPQQIAARTKMKRKHRNKAVDAIISQWDAQRVIETLYRDFKAVLDEARNKSTTGRGGGRWGR
jgi:hypothetical protein